MNHIVPEYEKTQNLSNFINNSLLSCLSYNEPIIKIKSNLFRHKVLN